MTKTIAVLFGGRSQESDVSVLTALQFISALDKSKFKTIPVYVNEKGEWFTGDALLKKENYLFKDTSKLNRCALAVTKPSEKGELMIFNGSFFNRSPSRIAVDVAVLAFHGPNGEDGSMAGLMQVANIPYVGPRPMAASVSMDKMTTKTAAKGLGIPVVEGHIIQRPEGGRKLLTDAEIKAEVAAMKAKKISFPVIVKPNHMGSSIGVSAAKNAEELNEALPKVFGNDNQAIIEPFVDNLVEYNVSVTAALSERLGEPKCSAAERPVADKELLDFSQKYLNHEGNDSKIQIGEGMASASRVINPDDLKPKEREEIEGYAKALFSHLQTSGVVRFDFLCDGKKRKFYLNEMNTIPGSFGYFLWEHSKPKVLFPALAEALINEAERLHAEDQLSSTEPPKDAQIFKR